jgi:hypothetical protein
LSTVVSTDRLDAMRRSAMARSFSWGLSAACYSALYRKAVSHHCHSAAALPVRRMSVDCFCIEAIDDFTNSVCSLTHSTGASACASWLA